MKNSAWYTKLWQTKMQELPLQGGEDAAWKKMQSLLDQQMPVISPVIKSKAGASLGVKLLYILAAIICIAILFYAGSKILKDDHKKLNKSTSKHARLNSNSADDKNYSGTLNSTHHYPSYAGKNGKTGHGKLNMANSTGTQTQFSAINKYSKNMVDIKLNSIIASTNQTSTSNNKIAGNSSVRKNSVIDKLNTNRDRKTSIISKIHLGKKLLRNNYVNSRYGQLSKNGNNTIKNAKQLSASGDNNNDTETKNQESNSNNTISPTNQNNSTHTLDTTNLPKNTFTIAKNAGNKPVAVSTDKNQAEKPGSKTRPSSLQKTAVAKFSFDVKLGANTNKGSNLDPFVGMFGNYNLNSHWGVSIGANALSTRLISGSYSKANLNYVTIGDSSKKITHNSGKLTISGTRKIYYVDVPLLVNYKISDRLTITGGPVISIPLKYQTSKNKLGPLSSSADTTTLRTVTPYVTSTTINAKINFSVLAGLQYSFKRFYLDAAYLQGISPYTISSGLGSGKIYYHTIQIGIGYHLYKAKNKR